MLCVYNPISTSKVRILDEDYNNTNDLFLISTQYYNEDGATIQTLADNIKGGVDVQSMQYDWSGKVLATHEIHNVPSTAYTNFVITNKYSFDALHRNTGLTKNIAGVDKQMYNVSYNELGQLEKKTLAPGFDDPNNPNSSPSSPYGIEQLNYSYNMHGWLTGINKDYALNTGNLAQWDHYFGIYLGYDNRDGNFDRARYDGKITGILWKAQGDNTPRRYDYQYDNAGRLIDASFLQRSTPAAHNWDNNAYNFTEKGIEYDENGNLKQLVREGILPGVQGILTVDNLTYTYISVNGVETNRLLKVFDNTTLSSAQNGKLGDFKDYKYNTDDDDYKYDENGNIVGDLNKNILSNGIIYNCIGKPWKIDVNGKGIIEFIYAATGERLAKIITPKGGGTPVVTDYLGGYVFVDNKLQYILHEEGRIKVYDITTNPRLVLGGHQTLSTTQNAVFEYFVYDHLGSVRTVLSEETHIEYHTCTAEITNTAIKDYEEQTFGQINADGTANTSSNELILNRQDITNIPGHGWYSNASDRVVKLSAAANSSKIGPNLLLKVMAGDNLALHTDYYFTGTVSEPPGSNLITQVLGSLISTIGGSTQAGQIIHAQSGAIQNTLALPGVETITGFLNSSTPASTLPKAFLNYIFFDENFNFIPYDNTTGLGSSSTRVTTPGDGQSITLPQIKIPKNGYAYVYLSNESNIPVYFDNLFVTHIRGRLVEENAYYPHGLRIATLSANAMGKLQNKSKYQGAFTEHDDELDLNWTDFALRTYDAQTARWLQPDPYDEFASPYLGMGNDPANGIDPSGGSMAWVARNALIIVTKPASGYVPATLTTISTGVTGIVSSAAGSAAGNAASTTGSSFGMDVAGDIIGSVIYSAISTFVKGYQSYTFNGTPKGGNGSQNWNYSGGGAAAKPESQPNISERIWGDILQGGSGPDTEFETADEAAFDWALKYGHNAGGLIEYASTIYMKKNKSGKNVFSYNYGKPGTLDRSDYHEKEIPTGAIIVGKIHLHTGEKVADNDFSKSPIEAPNIRSDENYMEKPINDDVDFYLLSNNGRLLVQRHERQNPNSSGSTPRTESLLLAEEIRNVRIKNTTIRFDNFKNWQDAKGDLVKVRPKSIN